MLNDLANPISTTHASTHASTHATRSVMASDSAPATTPLSRFARKLLVGISAVLAMGLAGVVFARTSEQRPGIVWVLRGRPIVVAMPASDQQSEAQRVVVLENKPGSAETDERSDASPASPQLMDDAQPQLATATFSRDQTQPQHAKPQAAGIKLPAPKHVVMMEVTAYCPCTKCCGPKAQGITASGKHVSYNDGKFVAGDRKLPFGTRVIIPGYGNGQPVEVIDRGGAIKGDKLDVFFPTHQEALEWGRQKIPVIVEG